MEFLKRLDEIGLVGPRRALAALVLSPFVMFFLLQGLGAPQTRAMFLALSACYLVAFVGVVAEWFWARWFASGLGWSGVMVAVALLVQVGWVPPLSVIFVVYGAMHLLIVLALMGKKMIARYDLQEAWRQRYGMDDFGVARLRKTVTRASSSLPVVIVWALGPKPDEGMLWVGAGVLAAFLTVAGLRGVVRMRSWGLLAMAGACFLLLGAGGSLNATSVPLLGAPGVLLGLEHARILAAALLAAAVIPFVGPAARFLARRA